MRSFCFLFCALALVGVVATTGNAAGKSDFERFDSALSKVAPTEAEFSAPPLKTKGALCLCNDGSNIPGFLVRDASLFLFCALPTFNLSGAYVGFSHCSASFEVLSK